MRRRRPRLLGGVPTGDVAAVVLLLPGGSVRSRRGPLRLAEWAFVPLRRMLRARGGPRIAVYLLRYRYRGWYAGAESGATAADTRWALGDVTRRHPGVPVVLVGNSLGGRAAVATADHPAVMAVAGVAPWLPPDVPVGALQGRTLLIVHGSADRSEAPALWSLAFAERARTAGVRVARFIVPGDNHVLLRRWVDWSAAVTEFVVATAGLDVLPQTLARGFDAGSGLSVPLPTLRKSADKEGR